MKTTEYFQPSIAQFEWGAATMKPVASLFDEAFNPSDKVELVPQPGRRRPKLWELPIRWHCPLIGTCLTVSDLRCLAKRARIDEPEMSDYTLHAFVVDQCGKRSNIAELIQRFLEERYALTVRQFSKEKGGDAVIALWRKALAEGKIVESLWAAWTHADIDFYDQGVTIYGELHMISHQLRAQGITEQKRLLVLEQDKAKHSDEAATLRQKLIAARRDHERNISDLKVRLAELERQAEQFKRDEESISAASKIEVMNSALRKRNDALNQRVVALEKRNANCISRIAELESALARKMAADELDPAAAPYVDQAPVLGFTAERPADVQLAGRRVLCIGGRAGLIDHYRRLVEASGGEFFHHDGGREENERRIDDIVASADIVVCQTGYVSHSAYWRLKNACKQRGLPCLFLKSGGVTSFARNLKMLNGPSEFIVL